MSLRSVLIRIVAVALVALGWIGMQNNLFRRSYAMRYSVTIPKATPNDLDSIAAELQKSQPSVKRNLDSRKDTLSLVIDGDSWSDTNNAMAQAQRIINQSISAKNLASTSSSSSGGYGAPGSRAVRFRFIGFAMLSLFGIAVFVLSLRLLGGGAPQLEESQEGHSV